MQISDEMYDTYVIESIYDCLGWDLQEINKKLYGTKLLYRWFILEKSGVDKLAKGIYLVDSRKNNKNQLKNDFINSVVSSLQKKHSAEYTHTSCVFNEKHGNLTGRKNAQLFLVIPLGNFSALQTPLATDLIDLLDESLPNKLKDLKKLYISGAFRYYEGLKKGIKNRDNILANNYFELKRSVPYFVKAVEDTIIESYKTIEQQTYHDGEVLLYCDKYILVDIATYNKLST